MKKRSLFLLLCLTLAVPICFAQSSGWLSWRGPSADGTTPEKNWSPAKILNDNTILWKTDVGTGHSAVAVQGNRVYCTGNFEIEENRFIDRVVCLDGATGKLIWKQEYAMKEGEDPGPFASPVIDGERLYTLSRGGHLHCFDAANGNIIWMKNLADKGWITYDAELACSPVIVNDLLILNVNQNGLALNKKTGEKVWTSALNKSSLSTAVPFRVNGKLLVATQTNDDTYAVDPATGEVRWVVPEGYIADPVFTPGRMLVFSYKGFSLYDITANPPLRIWNNTLLKSSFQSFVEQDGCVYGYIHQGGDKLGCIEVATGTLKWSAKVSAGSLILSNGILILLDKEGVLRMIDASPDGFRELASTPVMEMAATDTKGRGYRRISGCWTNPVLCDGKIYLRNTYGQLVCMDVKSQV